MNKNNSEKNHKYSGVIFAILLSLLWMITTSIISVMGGFESPREENHLHVLIAVLSPTIFFLILYALLPKVRNWTRSLSLAMLTLPHAWRTVGFTFLALWFYQILPAGFAAPAGFGDFAIAIAAPFIAVALWLKWSKAVPAALWFNILGLFDLFIALLTGVTGFGAPADQMTNIDPMTAFPMVIIPAVFVPLLILAHVISLIKILVHKESAS